MFNLGKHKNAFLNIHNLLLLKYYDIALLLKYYDIALLLKYYDIVYLLTAWLFGAYSKQKLLNEKKHIKGMTFYFIF